MGQSDITPNGVGHHRRDGSGRDDLMAWRQVDLAAVRHNVRELAAVAAPAELMVVVKADAYSHGACAVARVALEAGASRLGVAVLEEAFELRDGGIDAPVLAWLAGPGAPYAEAINRGIEVAAYSTSQLDEIVAGALRAGSPAVVHLKVETGMWRGGASDEWERLVAQARAHEIRGQVRVVGIWSHLACADDVQNPANDEQLVRFLAAVDVARKAGLRPRWRHLANSAATLSRPDMHLDMVRCGLAIFGVNPLTGEAAPVELRPAMTVRARVTHVKNAPAGVGVSYGHTYRTDAATTLALVPVGYADGLPVLAPGHRPVGWAGFPLLLAGKVCMDQCVVEVGGLPIAPGDEVALLGPGQEGESTAEEWSGFSGRSAYEMLTGLGRRRLPIVHVEAL